MAKRSNGVLQKANNNWERFLVIAIVLFQIFGVEPRLDSLEVRLGAFESNLASAVSDLATATSDIADLTSIRTDLVQDIEQAIRRAEGRGIEEGIRLICRHPTADDNPICNRRT